jgi:hypothetical protein
MWQLAVQIVRGETSDLHRALALARAGKEGLQVEAFGTIAVHCGIAGLRVGLEPLVPKPLAHVGPLMSVMLEQAGGPGFISQEHAQNAICASSMTDPFHEHSPQQVQNAVVCIGWLATADFGTGAIISDLLRAIIIDGLQ